MWIGTVLSLFIPPAGAAELTGDELLKAISKAWQDRQDRVKSARFVWKDVRTRAKGSVSNSHPPGLKGENPFEGLTIPPDDYTYETEVKASFERNSFHYSYTDKNWSPRLKALKESRYVAIFDGGTEKSLVEGRVHLDFPSGRINRAAAHSDVKNPSLRPLLMAFRSCHPHMRTYDIEQMTPTGRRMVINGQRCVEVVRRSQSVRGSYAVHLWLDSARDFVIVRETDIERDAVVLVQIDIEYIPDPQAGWTPTRWSINTTNPNGSGKFFHSNKVTVVKNEINAAVPASDFDIQFPAGTYVLDPSTREQYIVLKGGGRYHIREQDRGKSYEQVVATAGSQGAFHFVNTPLGLSLLLGTIGVAAVLVWRRYRHQSS